MINPTDEQLLTGVVAALKETVLPELARGSAARKQLQAALEILHRVAFAMPNRSEVLDADNADMAETIARIEGLLSEQSSSLNPRPNGEREGPAKREGEGVDPPGDSVGTIYEGGTSPPYPPGLRPGPTLSPVGRGNLALQTKLVVVQEQAGADPEITPLLIALHKRMTDRALALIPPPMPRTPRKSP